MSRVVPFQGRLPLSSRPLNAWVAAVCAILTLLLLSLVAPQAAGDDLSGPAGIAPGAELETGLNDSPVERDAPPLQDSLGEADDDLEDEREVELALPEIFGSVMECTHVSERSSAHLMLPRYRAHEALEKPPRV